MPLIFATDAPTLWESSYADIVGVQYEFPDRYRGLVVSGDRFLYYRGSRGASQAGAGYFGKGIVGDLRASPKPNHLIASVHDVELLADVIPIKDRQGDYFETGSPTGTNWANGVRRIPDSAYDAIMLVADSSTEPPRHGPAYASPAHALAMERFSINVVLGLLGPEFGAECVHEMPINNPGYDVVVRLPTGDLHVEVKGTALPTPSFHLSEGQRRHAKLMGEQWRIYVVSGIDVQSGAHAINSCNGMQLASWGNLQPEGWNGVLIEPGA